MKTGSDMMSFAQRVVDSKIASWGIVCEISALSVEDLQAAVRECCQMMDRACITPAAIPDVADGVRAAYESLAREIFSRLTEKASIDLPWWWLYRDHQYGESTYRRPRVYMWGYMPADRLKKILKTLDK